MMGDCPPYVGNYDTDIDAEDSSIFLDVSNISINDLPDEETVNIIPKVRSTFSGRSLAGEELQKMLGNDCNLNIHISGSVQDVSETEKPRHPALPVAPILKCYETIGPPRISTEQYNTNDKRIPGKDKCESGMESSKETNEIRQNEATSQMSGKSHQTSENIQHPKRMQPLDSLSELDQTLEEEDFSRGPITSTPIMDNSDTLPLFAGIRLLGMSIE